MVLRRRLPPITPRDFSSDEPSEPPRDKVECVEQGSDRGPPRIRDGEGGGWPATGGVGGCWCWEVANSTLVVLSALAGVV